MGYLAVGYLILTVTYGGALLGLASIPFLGWEWYRLYVRPWRERSTSRRTRPPS
ncbi:MAG: hypothetical protein ACREB9_09100 [Thermoplasmata archaeon]